MLSIRIHSLIRNRNLLLSTSRSFASKEDDNPTDDNHPFRRTLRLLGNDMKKVKNFILPKKFPNVIRPKIEKDSSEDIIKKYIDPNAFQTHCDVLIIGGGGVGSSIAFWIKQKVREGLNVVVVEKDSTVNC